MSRYWICSCALQKTKVSIVLPSIIFPAATVIYRQPIFVTVNGTEGTSVLIDAYSTSDNSTLTYALGSSPANFTDYVSVVGNQLVISPVPQSLLAAVFIIDVSGHRLDTIYTQCT